MGLMQALFRMGRLAWKLSTWEPAQITLTPPWQLPRQLVVDALIPGTLMCPISNLSYPSYLSKQPHRPSGVSQSPGSLNNPWFPHPGLRAEMQVCVPEAREETPGLYQETDD